MAFEIIATLGPSLLHPERLREVAALGPIIFRINGAHTPAERLAQLLEPLRAQLPDARVMIDLSGNKIRTANLAAPIRLVRGETFTLPREQLNYPPFTDLVRVGQRILANDSLYTLEIVEKHASGLTLRSHSDGLLHENKGMHVQGLHGAMPFLFARDEQLIWASVAARVDFLSLSFVRDAQDVAQVQRLLVNAPHKPELFAKIETQAALDNLDGLLELVDRFNIDRGDLSHDVGMLELPACQAKVIRKVLTAGKRIYLATQFLKNMEVHPTPLIAEVMHLQEAMRLGVSGIQLSEETAIGQHPVACVEFVFASFRRAMAG